MLCRYLLTAVTLDWPGDRKPTIALTVYTTVTLPQMKCQLYGTLLAPNVENVRRVCEPVKPKLNVKCTNT